MIDSPEKPRPRANISEVIRDDSFWRLVEDTDIDPSITERWRAMIDSEQLSILAVIEGGDFVGRVNVWWAEADEQPIRDQFPGVALINALHVNEDARKRGVGLALMQTAEKLALREGRTTLGLGVEPDNEAAIKLYEKLGYGRQAVDGRETYETAWDETLPSGTVNHVTAQVVFMTKELK